MKINTINNYNYNTKNMTPGYKTANPISFKATVDEPQQDTVNFKKKAAIKPNESLVTKLVKAIKWLFNPGKQETYTDAELYNMMWAKAASY